MCALNAIRPGRERRTKAMEEQPNQPLQPTNGVGTPSRFAKIMSAARG